MKKTAMALALGLLVVSSAAHAHLAVGTYTGQSPNGFPCGFDVQAVEFEGSPHPLNERVTISVRGFETLRLSHLPVINQPDRQPVDFERDALTGAKGVGKKSIGAVLKMSHEEGRDGPVELTLIMSEAGTTMKMVCGNLVAPESKP